MNVPASSPKRCSVPSTCSTCPIPTFYRQKRQKLNGKWGGNMLKIGTRAPPALTTAGASGTSARAAFSREGWEVVLLYFSPGSLHVPTRAICQNVLLNITTSD